MVARHNGKGVIFGYFFGPRMIGLNPVIPRHPSHKILWGQFGDLGLIKGEWPIVGQDADWRAEDWPMPPFIRVIDGEEAAFMTEYDPITLRAKTEKKCDASLVATHPYDRLMGYGSVELRLTDLLDPRGG